MSEASALELSCTAKLARVVLVNRGPLSPREVAGEARISEAEARKALIELEESDLAERVCAVCATREEVYALVDAGVGETDGRSV